MKRVATLLTVGTASAALLLSGCSSTSGSPAASAPVGTNAEKPAPNTTDDAASAQDASDDSADDATDDSANQKFGGTYKWKDGLSVTVSKPAKYVPSDTAFVSTKAKHYVQFVVTIVNGTKENYDPTLFTTTLQSGDVEAEEVIDSAKNISGSPNTKVLPGRQVKFKIAYTAPNPNDLVLEVSPDFDHDSALFTS